MSYDKRTFEQIIRVHKPITRTLRGTRVVRQDRLIEHSYKSEIDQYNDTNMEMDNNTKLIALGLSSSVVSISTYMGETRNFACSGFVIECNLVNNIFRTLVISSGCIKGNDGNCKIEVVLADGNVYEGNIVESDVHYNISLVTIDCDSPVPISTLRCINDSSDQINDLFKLSSQDIIMTLGRDYREPYSFMVAAGLFSTSSCNFDCEELLRMNCRIPQFGIGGPVINCHGEVIGMSFYASTFTPFLPINIIVKWWDHLQKNIVFRPPRLGIEASYLFSTDMVVLEKVHMSFPNVHNGIIAKKVKEGSTADLAGIQPEDVIVECFGHPVNGFLQFLDLVWDKVGEQIHLSVIRPKTGSTLNFSVVVDEPGEGSRNGWPLPETKWIRKYIYPIGC